MPTQLCKSNRTRGAVVRERLCFSRVMSFATNDYEKNRYVPRMRRSKIHLSAKHLTQVSCRVLRSSTRMCAGLELENSKPACKLDECAPAGSGNSEAGRPSGRKRPRRRTHASPPCSRDARKAPRSVFSRSREDPQQGGCWCSHNALRCAQLFSNTASTQSLR